MPDEPNNLDEPASPHPDPEDDPHGGEEAEHEAEADAELEDGLEADAELEDAQERQPQGLAPRRGKSTEENAGALRRQLAAERAAHAAERTRPQEAERRATERNAEREREREQEYLATLTPDERFEYLRNKDRREFGQQLNMLRFEQANSSDRADYKAAARTDPLYSRHADEVERIHAEHWSQGRHVPRETILDLVLGRLARQRRQQGAGTRQRAAGAERIARETTRPNRGARSDQRGERGAGQPLSARERLEKNDVKF